MNAATSLKEYVEIPMKELVESSSNPRKSFDEAALDELAGSIRSKGALSPLLVRRVNGHFEIVTGARRYRAAQRAGLEEIPVRIGTLPMRRRLKFKSSRIFKGPTCIRSRKRKVFVLCSTEK